MSHGRTFLVVDQAGRLLAAYRGRLPRHMALASEGPTLVYDLPIPDAEHRRVLDAVETFRTLAFVASGAPSARLVGGQPTRVISEKGHAEPTARLGRVLELLRN
jgi:hypothetical protein